MLITFLLAVGLVSQASDDAALDAAIDRAQTHLRETIWDPKNLISDRELAHNYLFISGHYGHGSVTDVIAIDLSRGSWVARTTGISGDRPAPAYGLDRQLAEFILAAPRQDVERLATTLPIERYVVRSANCPAANEHMIRGGALDWISNSARQRLDPAAEATNIIVLDGVWHTVELESHNYSVRMTGHAAMEPVIDWATGLIAALEPCWQRPD